MNEEAISVGDGELYDVLDSRSDEELAPLVRSLIASPASVLRFSRAYELNQTAHSTYTDRIADEVYRLAIEAMAQKVRVRPTYGEMLLALCAKVGLPVGGSDVARAESTLLAVFADRHLAAISSDDMPAALDAMSAALSAAVDGIFTTPAWPAFAGSMLRIAVLRRTATAPSASSVRGINEAEEGSLQAGDAPGALVVRDEEGIPILTLASLPESKTARWREFGSEERVASALVPVLKALEPFIAADRLLASGDYVRVGIKGGAAALSRSRKTGEMVGSAIGHKGQVPFLAVAAGSVAWPAALVVLATAHLEQQRFENIERSLDAIRSSLQDATRFQRSERRAVLTGSIRYFRQVSQAVLGGELDQEVLHEIERHEAELVRVQEHLLEDLDTEIATLRALKNDSWGTTKFGRALLDQQSAIERIVDEVAISMRARACGYQLLCAFPGREARKKARFTDLCAGLGRLCPDGELGGVLDALLREKLAGISSIEIKANVLGGEAALFERMEALRSEAMRAMDLSVRPIEAPESSTTFGIRFRDGKPVAITAE